MSGPVARVLITTVPFGQHSPVALDRLRAERIEYVMNPHGRRLKEHELAELAVGFESIEELDAALPPADWIRLDLPWSAGYLAGRCFGDYRRRGGVRPRPLPDFDIGAHAAVSDLVVVTRDATRFRTYFPRVELIEP